MGGSNAAYSQPVSNEFQFTLNAYCAVSVYSPQTLFALAEQQFIR